MHTTYHARSDPLGAAAAPQRRFDLPASLQDLGENPDIDATVTQLLSHTLAPLAAANGRRLHAHSFVKRGLKKSNTNLGKLTIAEYNTGFMRLMNNSRTARADKPNMFKHLGQLNEDAILYEWRGVRKWSEEVCAMVAEGELSWDDQYAMDLMCLKGPGGSRCWFRAAAGWSPHGGLPPGAHSGAQECETGPAMPCLQQWNLYK